MDFEEVKEICEYTKWLKKDSKTEEQLTIEQSRYENGKDGEDTECRKDDAAENAKIDEIEEEENSQHCYDPLYPFSLCMVSAADFDFVGFYYWKQ